MFGRNARCWMKIERIVLMSLMGLIGVLSWPTTALAQVEIEFETGVVGASRNDLAVPGDAGTRVSLVDDLSTRLSPFFRLRAGYRIADRHLVSFLYAPLQVNARGKAPFDIAFHGGSFPADTPLLAVYRFDSYRLTYRYSIVWRPGLDVAVGATAKIRDAEIELHGVDSRSKTNTGFVPLLNLHVEWRPNDGMVGLVFDADALAAPQGRAEDVLVALVLKLSDAVDVRVGYRMVEGGADNDEVLTFAWLHYGVIGMRLRL